MRGHTNRRWSLGVYDEQGFYPTVAGERRRRKTAVRVFPPSEPHLKRWIRTMIHVWVVMIYILSRGYLLTTMFKIFGCRNLVPFINDVVLYSA